MNKKQLLKEANNLYCRIQPSYIHGVGVFAIRFIPKGVFPLKTILKEEFISVDSSKIFNSDEVHSEVKKFIDDFYVTQNGRTFLSSFGVNGLNMSYYMNHSDIPNVAFIEHGENETDFIALRDIAKGEELTIDYNDF